METGLWVLDLLAVAWIGLWAVRQDRAEENGQSQDGGK